MPRVWMPVLKNFVDSKCAWGYMTLCIPCRAAAPKHVDLTKEVTGFPQVECELCGVRSA